MGSCADHRAGTGVGGARRMWTKPCPMWTVLRS